MKLEVYHLYTSAPALLAALEALVNQHSTGAPLTDAHWRTAIGALAQAKGEAQRVEKRRKLRQHRSVETKIESSEEVAKRVQDDTWRRVASMLGLGEKDDAVHNLSGLYEDLRVEDPVGAKTLARAIKQLSCLRSEAVRRGVVR